VSLNVCVSIIIPFYNAELYVKDCLNSLISQSFKKNFEIIMIDDGSTDNANKILKKFKFNNLKIYHFLKNSGPSAARNFGLTKAKGDYIFFLDVDDIIAFNTLDLLYNLAIKNNCDFVFSDFKRIENKKNLRENIYNYSSDKFFNNQHIKKSMRAQVHFNHFGHLGLFGINGRLIKRSIISSNNITFDEELRFGEDEIFSWYILSYVKKALYIRKQLYYYNVNPKVKSAVSDAINFSFNIINYCQLVMVHIKKCLRQRKFSEKDINNLGNQAFIYSLITVLVSYSRCMFLCKVNFKEAKKIRKKIINEIIVNSYVKKIINNYKCLKEQGESPWIPKAIKWRSKWFLEIACNKRAKEIIGKIYIK